VLNYLTIWVHDQQIAYLITKTFENKLSGFKPERQRHFCERLYRLTGKEKYIPYFGQFLFYLNISADKDKVIKAGRKIISQMRTKSWIKYYKKVPPLRFYQKLIFYLNKFREYQVNQVLNSPPYSQAINLLKNVDLEKYFLNQELIRVIPGQTTNYIFWLERLKIANLFPAFSEQLKNTLSQMEFKNQAYALTHVIIADSDYYQQFVEPQKYPWIIDFLAKNLKAVLTTNNKDLIAETGVTFKLVQSHPDLVEKIKSYLRSLFNPKKGYFGSLPCAALVRGKKNLEDLEHTNVLAILLFSNWSKLYPGPKIENI